MRVKTALRAPFCYYGKVLKVLQNYKLLLITFLAILVLIPVGLVVASYAIIQPYNSRVTTIESARHTKVGIVLGAGVTKDGKPFRELEARLDIAAEALEAGKVDKLILSGDNRFEDYNEPEAMVDYLVEEKHIDPEKLQPDYAGRSTYESCERARKIFGLRETVIFSAGSHLPRAIYFCEHFGVKATGIASDTEANNATRREMMARVKAVYNVHVKGEPTVLGTPIRL